MALVFHSTGHEWHVGEPTPLIEGYVQELQASGHELMMILYAMAATRKGADDSL